MIEVLEGRIAPAFAGVIELSGLDGTNGFQINGEDASDSAGATVSNAGDVNGDGFDDLLIGATGASPHEYASGSGYVIFGKANGFQKELGLSSLGGSNGFRLDGEFGRSRAGRAVGSAGDVNGDGFDDLLIGAPNFARSYLVFGKAGGLEAVLEL